MGRLKGLLGAYSLAFVDSGLRDQAWATTTTPTRATDMLNAIRLADNVVLLDVFLGRTDRKRLRLR
jgi:hypothetical protein